MKLKLVALPFAIAVGLALSACAPAPPRSVILIVVDTLRADHLGLYGYPRDTSPELDALAGEAAIFDHAFATSPWTLPSFGSLFTGRLPAEHLAGWPVDEVDAVDAEAAAGSRGFSALRRGVPTLAETLAAAGRDTAAVMNNAFLHPDFGVARGFDTYDHVGGNRRRIRRADEVVDRALDWLGADERGDVFLVVHFFDPHLEYDPPEPFRGRWSAELEEQERHRTMALRPLRQRVRRGEEVDWDFLIGAYDEEIAFTDQQIGRLFRELEASGRLESSLVILTADHGEEFGDHGGFEHGHTLYNELVRVPLLVWGPGIEPGRRPEPVSLIDLYPTILDLLEIESPASPPGQHLPGQGPTGESPTGDSLPGGGLPGKSLAASLRGKSRDPAAAPRTLIAERPLYGPDRESALAWPYKLIHEPDRPNRRAASQLFHLEEDPAEQQDLSRLRSDRVAELRARLDTHRDHARTLAAGEAVTPDEETLESLKSLGYIR